MTNVSVKSIVALSLTCIAVDAFAAFVSESDVFRAAEAFVSTDTVGSSVLSGSSVACVSKRDGLWVVALAPNGHVIFSGSDLVDPIVGFSKNDFVEPDPKSPAYSVLEEASASVVAIEAQGDGTRHARWAKLLGGGASKVSLLKAADIENPETVVIPPFLESHYNQWQPYNDYVPVYEASTNTLDYYRGRCPCGCVATAAVQGFRHFRWPARIDRVDSFSHSFTDANNVKIVFPLRFNGHVPVDWNVLDDDYVNHTSVCVTNYYSGGYSWRWESNYDLRGTVPESTRYPIARLIMFADVLANMSFKSSGSSANYGTVAGNASDWYTQGTWVSATDARVQSDIANGVPVQVTVPGHAVVGHGWANDGSNKYIYLNYGWGGSNDGYYNINGSTIQEVYVGHYPRAKPQIDPLPKVCETNVTLNWHFPGFYTNKLSGFTVSVSKAAATTSTFLDDFSATSGISDIENGSINNGDYDKIYIGMDSEYGSGRGKLLYVEPLAIGHFTYADKLTLTDSSMLSFKLRSVNANACVFEIQARFNDGVWTTVLTPPLSTTPNGYTADSGWQEYQVDLIGHIGETAQFRINKDFEYGNYYPSGRILLDDFSVSNVLQQEAPTTFPVDADKRSCEIIGLDAGSSYSFAVTPIMSGALVAAEASDFAVTRTAGEMLVPVEGEVTNVSTNSVFPANDAGVQWSYVGSVTNSCNVSSVAKVTNCCVSAQLTGTLTEDSHLIFQWKGTAAISSRYNTSRYDTLKVFYINENDQSTVLHTDTNKSIMNAASSCDISLSAYKGRKGIIKIELTTTRVKNYLLDGDLSIQQPCLTNICVQSQVYERQQIPALGMPEIRSVSPVSEGFYGECWTNTTTFSVVCSGTVETLEARPSHLSLVRDEDVTVTKTGSGAFSVSITPSGINESNFRSRMILTLVGTDSNGTKCYKDLSLRFSPEEPKAAEVHVSAATSSGDEFAVDIPYSWIETNGLASEGSDAAAHEAAVSANADADSDGLPNWAEYVCGTSPTDPAEKLVAFITMEDGKPVVTYSPGDSQIAAGFKAVIKGTTDLAAALSTWEVVTETRTSACRFFRVEIVPED